MPKEIVLDRNKIHIFTDGSCVIKKKGEGGPGGYAAVLLFNEHKREVSGSVHKTTNNEMELRAILEGLKALKKRETHPVIIYSDSQYCINCIVAWSNGWIRRGWVTADGKPVKNAEIIQQILKLKTPNMAFKWVKGHVGFEHNERADHLAGEARKNGINTRKQTLSCQSN